MKIFLPQGVDKGTKITPIYSRSRKKEYPGVGGAWNHRSARTSANSPWSQFSGYLRHFPAHISGAIPALIFFL